MVLTASTEVCELIVGTGSGKDKGGSGRKMEKFLGGKEEAEQRRERVSLAVLAYGTVLYLFLSSALTSWSSVSKIAA